jgi:hypothetical protein
MGSFLMEFLTASIQSEKSNLLRVSKYGLQYIRYVTYPEILGEPPFYTLTATNILICETVMVDVDLKKFHLVQICITGNYAQKLIPICTSHIYIAPAGLTR